MSGETKPNFKWVVNTIGKLLKEEGIAMPYIIVMDWDLAMMGAIEEYEP